MKCLLGIQLKPPSSRSRMDIHSGMFKMGSKQHSMKQKMMTRRRQSIQYMKQNTHATHVNANNMILHMHRTLFSILQVKHDAT